MTVIRSPKTHDSPDPSVFLAGGCAGDDWQSVVAQRLSGERLTVFNPRRPDYQKGDRAFLAEQVAWEREHLDRATVRLFWIPGDSDSVITLYELGQWANTARPMTIGIDSAYSRREEVLAQLELARPMMPVDSDLTMLTDRTARLILEREGVTG